MRVVSIIAVSLCLLSSGFAEQRAVLSELFSATWCTYCPNAEAAIDSLAHEMGPESLVVLDYHVSDGLAIPEGEERGDWYVEGTFYIPNMWFDGRVNVVGAGSVSGAYNIYRGHIRDRLAISSPLTLTSRYAIGDTDGEVSALIKVVEPFSQTELKAYVVLYENQVSGRNYVVRDILPTEDLTIASVGDSVEVWRSFSVAPQWNPDHMGVAIFVQSHSSKDVLQAARLELWMFAPSVEVHDYSVVDVVGNDDGRVDPGETAEVVVTLRNREGWQDAESVSVTISSDDSCLVLLDSISVIPYISAGFTAANTDDPFRFSVLPCSTHWARMQLEINAGPNDFTALDSFSILIGRPSLLIVDDDAGANYEQYYFDALDSLDVLYDCSSWLRFAPALEIRKYESVIWFTGDDSTNTLTQEDIDSLQGFLNHGRNLLITGQNLGEDIGHTPFYSDYLHAQFTGIAPGDYFVYGVDGDEIANDLDFVILGTGGASNQTSQDVLTPANGADSIFTYSQGGVAGVKYADTYKLVYLGFGFEAINDRAPAPYSGKPECARRILNWFGYSITEVVEQTEPAVHERLSLRVSPNPFSRSTAISYALPAGVSVTLSIYDVSGRFIRSLVSGCNDAGILTVQWDGRDLRGGRVPSGTYFVQLCSPYGTLTRKVLCIR